jgi:predicted ATPase
MGLAVIDRALAWIERTGMQATLAEVWRVRGELLLAAAQPSSAAGGADSEEAEACFHRSLEIAWAQEGHWLELRASMSLARLWQGQGRCDEARELLSGLYSWFSEGFDTVDLTEAKALLEELR